MKTPLSIMDKVLTKLKLIFIAFLLIAIGFIGLYTFLNWLLIIHTEVITVKQEIVDLWLPMALPWIPIWIWLSPRIKLLRLKKPKNDNIPFLYNLIAWFTIFIPTIIAQLYITTATGKLTRLETIGEIEKREKTKYYTLERCVIDKFNAEIHRSADVSGKYNQELNLHIFVACPILPPIDSSANIAINKTLAIGKDGGKEILPLFVINGKPVDTLPAVGEKNIGGIADLKPEQIESITVLKGASATAIYGEKGKNGVILITTKHGVKRLESASERSVVALSPPSAWLGIEYEKTISNRLSQQEKEREFETFSKESFQDFEKKNLQAYQYLSRMSFSDEYDGYKEAIKLRNRYVSVDSPIVLLPVNEQFEAREGNKLKWVFVSFGIGASIFLLMIVIPKLHTVELRKFLKGRASKDSELKDMLEMLLPKEGFYITPILINLNLLLYILMLFAGLGIITFQGKDLVEWGANYGPLTKGGQWWRLFSNIFLHGGIMHLLFNMFGLFFVGVFLEPILGRARLLFAYITTGILASIASIFWYEATVSVGASGAIFGLYGVFIALLTTKLFPKEFKKTFLSSIAIYVGINLLMGIAGGIDNAAHIGGLLSGIVIGYAYYFYFKQKLDQVEIEEGMEE